MTNITFRHLSRADFVLVEVWLCEPHVAEWWDEPRDLSGLEREFGPCIDRADPTLVFLILIDEDPAGLIQTYRLDDNPAYAAAVGLRRAAGVDLFLGDPSLLGRGVGTAVIREFLTAIVWPAYGDLERCMAGPSVRNARSQRAFEKAGFARLKTIHIEGEEDDELVMVTERPHSTSTLGEDRTDPR